MHKLDAVVNPRTLVAPAEPLSSAADAAVDGRRADPPSGDAATSAGLADASSRPWAALRARTAAWSDARLASVISAALFVLSGWFVALTDVPPFQDLPNHLAAVTVIKHPELYPEYVVNGFFKTNTALFAWLSFVGSVTGTKLAAKLFTWVVLAANAIVLPRFVLELTGSRARMVVASAFAWPMVHNWFVSMGMLDFAFGVPLSLTLLVLIQRQRTREATWPRAVLIGLVGLATWYAHVFSLMMAGLLLALEMVHEAYTTRAYALVARKTALLALPLVPVCALVAASLQQHFSETGGALAGFVSYKKLLAPWELGYKLWAEWMWGFTKLSLTSLVPTVGLAYLAWRRRREAPPFFSPFAVFVLAALYAFGPHIVTNWFHVNSRVIAYLWAAALLRVPERLEGRVPAALALSAVLYSGGMGADYVRLDRDRREFIAGVDAVPPRAKLLPLVFRPKHTSENTRSLLHAWGFYVAEKETSAPLLFAHSRSFPLTYRTPPDPRFNHLVLENFVPSVATERHMCRNLLEHNIIVADCGAYFAQVWREFWVDATPRFDHLLLWDAPEDAVRMIPPAYRPVFQQGRLAIYARITEADHPAESR